MVYKICSLAIVAVICFNCIEANPAVKYDKNGCALFEYYDPNYPGCEPSCDDRNPKFCSRIRGSDCHCIAGFIRNENQDCVPIRECPGSNANQCGLNEYYNAGHNCEPTCDDPEPFPCSRVKLFSNCYCKEGFYRNKDQKCVKFSDCNKRRGGDIIFPDN